MPSFILQSLVIVFMGLVHFHVGVPTAWSDGDRGVLWTPLGDAWERYLPRNVRQGNRNPTAWELSEAKRKSAAKAIRVQRSMAEAERRRQVIAHRRATGWYDARRHADGFGSLAHRMHMSSYGNEGYTHRVYRRYPSYVHSPSCAPMRHSY